MNKEVTLKWWQLYLIVTGLVILGVGVTHISYGNLSKGLISMAILPVGSLYYLLFRGMERLDKRYPWLATKWTTKKNKE